jgi:hypothetical protein
MLFETDVMVLDLVTEKIPGPPDRMTRVVVEATPPSSPRGLDDGSAPPRNRREERVT